jgi:nucleoside-diphosphate-sugar epimerase
MSRAARTVLVTGAAGFLGQRVVLALRRRGWRIVTTDRQGGVDHRGDLTDEAFVSTLPAADAVVHAAAVQYVTPRLPLLNRQSFFERNNVVATRLLAQRYAAVPGLHFVNIGTSMMYRQCRAPLYAPDSELLGQGVYSHSKLAAQREVERAVAHWATVVPCIIGGPGREGLFRGFVQSIRRGGRVFYPGRGEHPIAMVHVDDVAELVAVVIECRARGLFNAAAHEALTIAQWATHIADELGVPPPRHRWPRSQPPAAGGCSRENSCSCSASRTCSTSPARWHSAGARNTVQHASCATSRATSMRLARLRATHRRHEPARPSERRIDRSAKHGGCQMSEVLSPEGRRPAAQARSKTQTPLRARWFWLACLLLSVLLIAPLWMHEHPGMTDYPNHWARAQLIVDAQLHRPAHPYFALRHALIANLALETLVPLFVHAGMDTQGALKLFAALALLLPVAGVIALAWVLQGGTPWLALLAFALAHSRYFAWGFLNYFFALGLGLLVFALWLRLREEHAHIAALALALLGAVVMGAHLMGFGVLALLVLSREAWQFGRRRAVPSRERWRPALPALMVLAAWALFYRLAFERGLGLKAHWFDTPASKLRNLASPFMAYDILPGLAVMTLVVGVMLWLWCNRRLHFQPGWWLPVGLFVLAFVLMPSVIMNSHYVSARLAIVAALVFLAFATLRADKRAQAAVMLVALAATAIRLAEVHTQWTTTSARTAELRQALHAVPLGAKVATVITVGHPSHSALYPLRHVASFAIIDRQALSPTSSASRSTASPSRSGPMRRRSPRC